MGYVYTWYDPDLHALKIGGCGANRTPYSRMRDYARVHSLGYDANSLLQVPVMPHQSWYRVETMCKSMLSLASLSSHGIFPRHRTAHELFFLHPNTNYRSIADQVIEWANPNEGS